MMLRKEYERILECLDNVLDKVEGEELKEIINDIANAFDNLYFDMEYEVEKRQDEIESLHDYIEEMRYSRRF
ncbi:MAG TPA: hypothetical protein DCW90_06500 [Lachnospiraceae bacterium]|nr:hypothetical protein [uncultured Lachnoclostridium sp.]HAU85149.1 hypothetical protein [Lachnospiraceae bacterium]